MSKPTVKELRQLVTHLESQRTERLAQVEKLGEYILPHRGFFTSDTKTTGTRRQDKCINNAALRSLRRGAAGMTAGMTPASLPWFKHEFVDAQQRELSGARRWSDVVDERIAMVLGMGGFYQAIHAFNQELIGFGSALLYTESNLSTIATYQCCTWGTWLVSCDSGQALQVVARDMHLTAREALQRFGKGNVSNKVVQFATTKPYEQIKFTNIVQRRDTQNSSAGTPMEDNTSMPFASYWLEENATDLSHESGYAEMPYAFAVWEGARNVYGTGPGDDALGDAKQLDAMERRKIVGLDLMITPPITKPSSFKGRVSTLPGAQTPINSDLDRQRLAPIYETNFGPALQYVQQELSNLMQRMDDTLLATVFADSPIELRPAGITATEWAGRRRERLQMMGPTLAAYEPNVLSNVLERTYGLLDRAGQLPPPPEGLGPMATLDVEYLSPLSQALRSSNGEAIMAFLGQIMGILQIDQQTVDKLDTDQIIDELARANGTPGSIVRADDDVAALRAQRAQAQAKAQEAEAQMAMMEQAKGLAETKVGADTLAGALMQTGQMGQAGQGGQNG